MISSMCHLPKSIICVLRRVKMDKLANQWQLDLLLILVCSLVGFFIIYQILSCYWPSIKACCIKSRAKNKSRTCLRSPSKENVDFLLNGSTYKRFTQELDEDEEVVIWNSLNQKLESERKKETEMIQL